MFMKSNILRCVVILLIVSSLCFCIEGAKFKRKMYGFSDLVPNSLRGKSDNNTNKERTSRGLFGYGGLFSLGKVLNFFPVGEERECQPVGQTLARAGICLNPYDCRQRDGKAAGDCAHGLGVCCVFEVTCGGTVQNNLTYFMSPGFPELWYGEMDCNITVEKTHAGIMQLRIDFIHFTLGQPNRTTGECDEDAMIVGEGATNFTVCGQNHGQHIYYNLPTDSVKREEDELASTVPTRVTIRARGDDTPRLWLLRLAQLPLAQAAPHSCLQHHTDNNGTIKTFNYAVNGRHLASQEYRACVRRNVGFCSIRYWPCDANSFRIGPNTGSPMVIDPAVDGLQDDEEDYLAKTWLISPVSDSPQMEELMPVETQDDMLEGSGDEPQPAASTPAPGLASRIWSFIWPSWLWGQWGRSLGRWSPYTQHLGLGDALRFYGYGNFGAGLRGHGRLRCADRVTIPCENEYFVGSSFFTPGVCDPHHCGNNFCPGEQHQHCRVESTITPFAVSVHFGPPTPKRSPEDNIGMCLRYSQVPCNS